MISDSSAATCQVIARITPAQLWFVAFSFLAAARVVCASDLTDFDPLNVGAKNIAVPLFSKSNGKSVAVLRAGRVFQDFERKGFFRIGLLPVLAIEDLRLEVRDAAQLASVLDQATSQLGATGNTKRIVDGRQFSILFTAQTNSTVCARHMRVESPRLWRLDDVTVTSASSSPVSSRRAWLHTSGERAGELIFEARSNLRSIQLSNVLSSVIQARPNL